MIFNITLLLQIKEEPEPAEDVPRKGKKRSTKPLPTKPEAKEEKTELISNDALTVSPRAKIFCRFRIFNLNLNCFRLR